MTTIAKLPDNEIKTLLHVVQQSFAVRRHWDLFAWLQNDVQHFLPHEIMIAAWGDFSLGLISYDIVSPLPGVRTGNCKDDDIVPLLLSLSRRWLECGNEPFVLRADSGFAVDGARCPDLGAAMARMRCGLVHGINDQRGRDDCIYALLGPAHLGARRAQLSLRYLLPHIDAALRQIAQLPDRTTREANEVEENDAELLRDNPFGMSHRELEIMDWVRRGKTNQEIGMILDISAFTVKNHLQRIFRKANVLNRAQAVAKLEASFGNAG